MVDSAARGDSGADTAKILKKRVFTRPSWASKRVLPEAEEAESTDVFSRRNETLALIERAVTEPRTHASVGSSSEGDEVQYSPATTHKSKPKYSKRRRVESLREDDSSDEEHSNASNDSASGRKHLAATSLQVPVPESRFETSRSPRPAISSSRMFPPLKVIELSDEDDKSPIAKDAATKHRSVDERQSIESPPQRHDPRRPTAHSPKASGITEAFRSESSPEPEVSPLKPKATLTAEQQRALDQRITILIHSQIPNTEPLIVARRIGQRLKEVKEAWLKRQTELTVEQKAEIFLMWRDIRIYDFSKCSLLGLKVNELGEVYHRGKPLESEDGTAQIALEAVTTQIVENNTTKKEKEAEAVRSLQNPSQGAEMVGNGQTQAIAVPDEGFKIIVRGKGCKNYKLKVKKHTKFSHIASAFRKQNNVPSENSITLTFDGDDLDPEHELQSLEDIEQGDFIDARVN